MITSVHAKDIFDIAQLLLDKLGLSDQYTVNDLGCEFGVKAKYREGGKDGEDTFEGNYLFLDLRSGDAKNSEGFAPTKSFTHLEIPIDYRVQGDSAYNKWLREG